MKQKVVLPVVILIILGLVIWGGGRALRQSLGVGLTGPYPAGSCQRNDEMGVTYKIEAELKGNSFGKVVVSDKYPSNERFKIGATAHWSEPWEKMPLVTVACPH